MELWIVVSFTGYWLGYGSGCAPYDVIRSGFCGGFAENNSRIGFEQELCSLFLQALPAPNLENRIRAQYRLPLRTHYAVSTDGVPIECTAILNRQFESRFYGKYKYLNN